MYEFKLFTEDKNEPEIEAAVQKWFDDFSIIGQTGYWGNVQEDGICIIIIAEARRKYDVLELAETIKELNGQEAVLVTGQRLLLYEMV